MTGIRQKDLWDPERESRFREQIFLQISRLSIWLQANAGSTILDHELVRWFHRRAFERIFPVAAGLVRSPACPFNVAVGGHSSAPWQVCEGRFTELCQKTIDFIQELDKLSVEQVHERALHSASWHHANFIAIHPFLDGNGRIGRLCVNYFAARYGLRSVQVTRTGMSDYEQALGAFLQQGHVGPLVEYFRVSMWPERPV